MQTTTTLHEQRLIAPKPLELSAMEELIILEHLPTFKVRHPPTHPTYLYTTRPSIPFTHPPTHPPIHHPSTYPPTAVQRLLLPSRRGRRAHAKA